MMCEKRPCPWNVFVLVIITRQHSEKIYFITLENQKLGSTKKSKSSQIIFCVHRDLLRGCESKGGVKRAISVTPPPTPAFGNHFLKLTLQIYLKFHKINIRVHVLSIIIHRDSSD